MSKTSYTLSKKEIISLNSETLKVRGRTSIANVYWKLEDGKKIAGFAMDSEYPKLNDYTARRIGEIICSIYPEIDEVWHNAHKVYAPSARD